MRVNFNFGQPSQSLFHVNGINGKNSNNRIAFNRGGNDRNQDRVNISPQGKMMSQIDNLTKQKERLVEQKSKLVTKTLESGKDIEAIQGQLDLYEEQFDNIEKQISKIMADMAKQAIEKQEEKKAEEPDESKSAEQLEAEKLTKVANASTDVKQAGLISSVKEKVGGDIRVKKAEIETDVRKIEDLKTKNAQFGARVKEIVNRITGEIGKKEDLISELQEQSDSLSKSQGKKLNEASGNLDEAGRAPEDGEKTEETKETLDTLA